MNRVVYHFTTTCALPRILRSGELRPATYDLRLSEVFHDNLRDFLHVTTREEGEPTASGWLGSVGKQQYREGTIRRVRFTLDAADFEPWRQVYARYSGWTPERMEGLEQVARANGHRSTEGVWLCRADPLPLSKVIAVHTRSYLGHGWEPFDFASAEVFEATTDNPQPGVDCLAVEIGGKIYASECTKQADGAHAFRPAVPWVPNKRKVA